MLEHTIDNNKEQKLIELSNIISEKENTNFTNAFKEYFSQGDNLQKMKDVIPVMVNESYDHYNSKIYQKKLIMFNLYFSYLDQVFQAENTINEVKQIVASHIAGFYFNLKKGGVISIPFTKEISQFSSSLARDLYDYLEKERITYNQEIIDINDDSFNNAVKNLFKVKAYTNNVAFSHFTTENYSLEDLLSLGSEIKSQDDRQKLTDNCNSYASKYLKLLEEEKAEARERIEAENRKRIKAEKVRKIVNAVMYIPRKVMSILKGIWNGIGQLFSGLSALIKSALGIKRSDEKALDSAKITRGDADIAGSTPPKF